MFFDLETGGLDLNRHAIIQIAAIAVDAMTLKPIDTFECKVKFPPTAAEKQALALNSYDPKLWDAEAIHPDDAGHQFAEFCKRFATHRCVSAKGNEYYVADSVAYNGVSFDMPFLQAWYKRRKVTWVPLWPQVLDPLQLAMWTFKWRDDGPENFKLQTVAAYFGIDTSGQHDALKDVRATVEVTKVLREQAKQSEGD